MWEVFINSNILVQFIMISGVWFIIAGLLLSILEAIELWKDLHD